MDSWLVHFGCALCAECTISSVSNLKEVKVLASLFPHFKRPLMSCQAGAWLPSTLLWKSKGFFCNSVTFCWHVRSCEESMNDPRWNHRDSIFHAALEAVSPPKCWRVTRQKVSFMQLENLRGRQSALPLSDNGNGHVFVAVEVGF